jgi:hypothetical protein
LTVQQTFRAFAIAYVKLCGIWVLLAGGYILISIHTGDPQYTAIIVSLLPAIAFGLWLAAFRLDFHSNGICYRSLFSGRRRILYSEIVVESRISAPLSSVPNRSKLELASGDVLEVTWKVFPIEAAETFREYVSGNEQ